VEHYELDKRSSKFTVRAYAGGMLSMMGHDPIIAIRDFTGVARFDRAAMEEATFHIEIRANSLEVTGDISSMDRKEMERTMNGEVLQSAKYPSITFDSTVVSASPLGHGRYRVHMNGTLSLRGATGRFPVVAQVSLFGDSLRASGEFSLSQTEYAIPLVTVAGGALKLKDELKFSFDIVARKQE
jgi:polyisoprenoid-binding protein YceI